MDVDSDVDAKLLQQFSSMGTTDREVLISEFQKLLGNQLNPTGCAFFLDMNNWNLQAAVCSYYDFEQPNIRIPLMTFIKDVTIGDGESIPPNNRFIKTWRVQNSGTESWPPGCCLKFCNGDQLGIRDRVMVEALQPGQSTDISVEMTSPSTTGVYQGQWRMSTATGMFFGEVIWVIITVEENGLMGVTQQLSRIGGEISTRSAVGPVVNPFASPSDLNQSVSDMRLGCVNELVMTPQRTPSTPNLQLDYYRDRSQGSQLIAYDQNTEMTEQSEDAEMS